MSCPSNSPWFHQASNNLVNSTSNEASNYTIFSILLSITLIILFCQYDRTSSSSVMSFSIKLQCGETHTFKHSMCTFQNCAQEAMHNTTVFLNHLKLKFTWTLYLPKYKMIMHMRCPPPTIFNFHKYNYTEHKLHGYTVRQMM